MSDKPTYEELEQRVKELEKEARKAKRLEETLLESDERLRAFMGSATDSFSIYDSELNFVDINEAGAKFFPPGTKKEDIIGSNMLKWAPILKPSGRYDKYLEVIRTGRSFSTDDIVTDPMLGEKYVKIRAFKVGDGLGIVGTNITERKHLEEALRKAHDELEQQVKQRTEELVITNEALKQQIEERKQIEASLSNKHAELEAIFNSIPDAVVCADLNRNMTKINPGFTKLFGYEPKDVYGKKTRMLYTSEEEFTTQGKIRYNPDARDMYDTYEIEYRKKNGEVFLSETIGTPVRDERDEAIGLFAIVRDITKSKQAEEALLDERDNLTNIMNSMKDGVYIVNQEHDIEYVNPALMKDFGPFEGRKCYEYFQDRNEACPWCKNEDVFAGKTVRWEWYSFKNQRTYDLLDTPLRNIDGSISKLEIFRDITDVKRAQDALRESEEKLRSLFNDALDMIHIVEEDGKIIDANPAELETMAYTRDEYLGKHILEIVHPDYQTVSKKAFETVYEGKEVKGLETAWITKHGERIDVEVNAVPQTERKKIVTVRAITRDISERKRAEKEKKELEAKLQQAQKMEAIGTLAGGIAHDFNNLLMGIQGNVSLMVWNIDTTHPHYERLKNIEKQIESGAALTSHLLGYARKGKYQVRPLDLNQLVRQTSDTFGRTRKQITIHQQLAKDLFAIEADVGQTEQVLWNLLINAADAMPGGGDLVLKLTNVTHEDMKGKLYDPKPGTYVQLMVADTGIGMDKETMERVFDPFFTTKEMGRGTGLGLASAYGIIKGHGGYIDVQSNKGQGTTFSIYLPASRKN
jgi:PAS domain S-box-containing protein